MGADEGRRGCRSFEFKRGRGRAVVLRRQPCDGRSRGGREDAPLARPYPFFRKDRYLRRLDGIILDGNGTLVGVLNMDVRSAS